MGSAAGAMVGGGSGRVPRTKYKHVEHTQMFSGYRWWAALAVMIVLPLMSAYLKAGKLAAKNQGAGPVVCGVIPARFPLDSHPAAAHGRVQAQLLPAPYET